MKASLRAGSAALLVAALASACVGNPVQAPATGPHHTVVAADGIAWKPLRPGAEIAVVSGDPNKDGSPFVLTIQVHGLGPFAINYVNPADDPKTTGKK